ncbi:MAG: ribosome maturation factor RimP [Erysipelotrichaceae bacterium]|nr:ribosome maturation factor RimP [Erysipelotrichaceae bacterium]
MIASEKYLHELTAFIENLGYRLFEIKTGKADGNDVLEVVLDESLDLDSVAEVSQKISEWLDQNDDSEDPYMLDVSCIGAERPLRNTEEICAAVGKYVWVKTKAAVYEGDLIEADAEKILLSCRDKTRNVKVTIPCQDIKKMRLAVKF